MRIAIVKLSSLGDIIHAMIVLQFIKKFNPNICIDWIVDESYKDLLTFNPHIDNLYLLDLKNAKKNKSILSLIKELRFLRNKEIYDLVIDMQGLIKSSIVTKLLPSKKTVGFDKFSARESFSSIFYNKKYSCSYDKNVILRNIGILEFALNFKIETRQIYNKVPFLYPNSRKLGFKISSSKKNIILIPGASHPSKRYSIKNFVDLIKLIDANFYLVWGTEEEKIIATKIKKDSPKVNICKKLQLDSLIFLISKVDLVIGPDTGPTHIAWAMNVPSITLFGPTPSYRNAFQTNKNRVINPQSDINSFSVDLNEKSINNIKTQYVADVAKELLQLK
jgi:heptosyltransferase-1